MGKARECWGARVVAPLEMNPTAAGLTAVPWPPATPAKRAVQVGPTDSFTSLCVRENCSFKELIQFNFGLDIEDPALKRKWPKIINYYLRTKLRCTRLTPGGNYRFSGSETLYLPQAPTKRKAQNHPILTVKEVIQWFEEEMIPKRTDPAGTNLNRLKYIFQYSDPNGLCGAAATFVKENEPARMEGFQIGFVLWRSAGMFTHIGNVLLPKDFKVAVFSKNSAFVKDETPERYKPVNATWAAIRHFPVLDLYFKKVSSVERWWSAVSYAGWGTLTLDSNGQFIHEAD